MLYYSGYSMVSEGNSSKRLFYITVEHCKTTAELRIKIGSQYKLLLPINSGYDELFTSKIIEVLTALI